MIESIRYIDITIVICIVYILLLFKQSKYRLLLPSSIHTITWLFVVVLIKFTIHGYIGYYSESDPVRNYHYVAPFILGLTISSIIGFSLAHIRAFEDDSISIEPNLSNIDENLRRYRWILYICFLVGLANFWLVYSVFGLSSLGDYRVAALTVSRVGIWAYIQRLSGHITILGAFYLGVLGYKHSYSSIKLSEFFFVAVMVSATNLAIGGRLWIITILLSYFITYFGGKNQQCKKIFDKDTKKVILILIILVSSFSIIGSFRSNGSAVDVKNTFEKFLYYTDGARMTNLAMSQYPESGFEYELGRSEFLSKFIGSPLNEQFNESISYDIGLSVTVQSSLIPLYFDFGFRGGIIVWGIFCFVIESLACRLRYSNTIIGVLFFLVLTRFFYQSPIFQVFSYEHPSLVWLLIIYLFRNKILRES